jgi:hypothetical protein
MKSSFDRKKIGKPPQGYIPGVFRGCHGFITRMDYGPMQADASTIIRGNPQHQVVLGDIEAE